MQSLGHRRAVLMAVVAVVAVLGLVLLLETSKRRHAQEELARRQTVIEKTNQGTVRSTQENAKRRGLGLLNGDASHRSGYPARLVVKGRVTLAGGAAATSASVEALRFESTNWRMLQTGSLVDRRVSARVSGSTNRDGRYLLECSESAMHRLQVRCPGYATDSESLSEDATAAQSASGPRTIVRDVTLVPSALMRGSVHDENGQPIPGASIAAIPAGRSMRNRFLASVPEITTSSASGGFGFDCFSASDVAFSVCAPGYVTFSGRVQLPKDNIDIVLKRGGASIRGVVHLKSSGEAVAGARVVARPEVDDFARMAITPPNSCVSSSDGSFELTNLGAGSYWLIGQKDRLQTYIAPGSNRGQIRLAEKEAVRDREVLLYPGHTVTGKVSEQSSKQGLSGVRVSEFQFMGTEEGASTMTLADGTYRLEGLSPWGGEMLMLQATCKGYTQVASRRGPQAAWLRLSPDELEARCDILMTSGVQILGTVHQQNGMPVAGAAVSEENAQDQQQEPIQSDANGHFEIFVAPFQRVTLQASAQSYAPARSKPLQVRDTPLTSAEIIMGPGATLEGQVVDEQGTPVSQADVTARETDGGRRGWFGRGGPGGGPGNNSDRRALSDAQGMFRFTTLPAGTIELNASKEGFRPSESLRVEATHGMTTSGLVLKLGEQHFIAGQVKDRAGKALAGVEVSARMQSNRRGGWGGPGGRGGPGGPGGRGGPWGGSRTETAPDGTYRIDDLSSGTYSVSAQLSGYKDASMENVQTDRSDVDLTLASQAHATFIGKVVNAQSNQPLAEFQATELRGRNVTRDEATPGRFTVVDVPEDSRLQFEIKATGFSKLRTPEVQVDMKNPNQEHVYSLEPEGQIKGRVVDAKNHTGIEGVKVSFTAAQEDAGGRGGRRGGPGGGGPWRGNNALAPVLTASDGSFTMTGVGSGTYTASFQPPTDKDYGTLSRQVVAEAGAAIDMGDIELGAGGAIRGHVVRMPGSKGVSGVQVSVEGSRGETPQNATTDIGGAFNFTGLRNGSYTVRVVDHDVRSEVNLQANETREITLRLGAAIFKGMVVYDAQPIQASLQLVKSDTSDRQEKNIDTAEDGTFYISDIAAGKWDVTVYGRQGRQRRASVHETVQIPEQGTIEKNIVLPSSRLIGTVVDGQGNAVANANVTAQLVQEQADPYSAATPYTGEESSAQSGADGTFSIRGLQPGRYQVQATHSQYGRGSVGGVDVVSEGEVGPITVTLAQTGNSTLVSVALNMSSRGPLRNAWCMLWKDGQRVEHSARRDDSGVMTIQGLDAGVYHVQVSAYGYSVGEHDVTLEPGKEARIEDVLYAAGGVRIHVWNAQGQAAAGAACTLSPMDASSVESPRQGQSDANGVWTVRGIMPGQYGVMAQLPGGQVVRSNVAIESGQASDFDLRPGQ